MIHLTIPVPTRTLANVVIAEMQTISRAFNGSWTTPEALQMAYHAALSLDGHIAALRADMRHMAEETAQ
jgi:hypothetical protein